MGNVASRGARRYLVNVYLVRMCLRIDVSNWKISIDRTFTSVISVSGMGSAYS